jgi:DNA-binding FrmR family transcriptional regulator
MANDDDHGDVQRRLRSITGQVEGISRMVAQDRDSLDILTQIGAARAALRSLGHVLVLRHLSGSVPAAVAADLVKVIERAGS